MMQPFLPSSTRVELCLPTMLGVLSSLSFFLFEEKTPNLTTVGIELKDQR